MARRYAGASAALRARARRGSARDRAPADDHVAPQQLSGLPRRGAVNRLAPPQPTPPGTAAPPARPPPRVVAQPPRAPLVVRRVQPRAPEPPPPRRELLAGADDDAVR